MTTRAAYAAVLITVGDRLPELHNEIGRRKYPADLDERVITLARDFERVLEQHGELTDKRRARLSDVAGELQTARAALAAGKAIDAQAAFDRATGCINAVVVDVTHGPVL
jgi:hypothetical protein